MPRSVQQSIPIDRIYADGVWQSENVFSLMWQISDINYAMQSDAAKQNILTQLGTVYAGIPADCWMQVCIVSQRMDEKAFARDVLYHRENDGFDALRAERNRQIKANARENGNVVQHKYIIVSTNKPGVKEARERFVQVQGHLLSAFSALECAVTPLDNRARLEVLHKFFRISEEGRFNFDFDNCAKLGQDFRDSIAPDCIRFCKKHIEIEDFYAKCMTISEYPQQLDDKFISALLQQVPYIVLSIDIEPVETEDAFKEIDNAQMKTDAEKVRFNKKSVENLDFTSSVPQRTQEQDRIIASIRKEMTENDQQMFLSLLTVTYFADTLEDLALETDALKTTAANYNCRFTELYFQQERAFNTAMPYGLRRIESVRTMLTKSLTALVPFNTQEILTPGGICYGRNAVTGNLIIGLRTSLVNGNAMVVATSGGGKSMFVKLEILMLYLRFNPIVRTVIMSFFKVESLTASTSTWSFYGLQNYFKILRNAGFISSMKNMVMIWLVGGIITMCLSMLMAVILTSGIRGAKFFKAAIYMPNIISAVALATMWIQYVFNYDYGLLNQIVKAFGGENVRWLGTDLIFWAMMIAFIFGSVGYYMLIFISGIEGIPQDLYEAATIDGANIFDRFFQITLPLLKGVIRTCVTFWSINATTFFLWTKMFSPINTETATIVPVVYLYDTVFGGKGVVERDAGAGAAVGVVLTLIIIAVYVITNLILKDSDLEY